MHQLKKFISLYLIAFILIGCTNNKITFKEVNIETFLSDIQEAWELFIEENGETKNLVLPEIEISSFYKEEVEKTEQSTDIFTIKAKKNNQPIYYVMQCFYQENHYYVVLYYYETKNDQAVYVPLEYEKGTTYRIDETVVKDLIGK